MQTDLNNVIEREEQLIKNLQKFLKLEDGKETLIEVLGIGANHPVDSFGKPKAEVNVIVEGNTKVWNLGVTSPAYSDLLKLLKEGHRKIKVTRQGKGIATKYTLVAGD